MSERGTWKGFPREEIPWYPTVDEEKCAGCKKCFEFCPHDVYAWDEEKDKSKVAEPFECVVGCSNCAGLCEEGAITFPPLTILAKFAKEEK